MKKSTVHHSEDNTELRNLAKARLKEKQRGHVEKYEKPLSAEETQRLVQELQVRKTELAMQNEKLKQAMVELEAWLVQLYDFAPVGYFTLERNGVITQTNLVGARLLGLECSQLSGKRFSAFVSETDLPTFNAFVDQVFSSVAKQTFEVELVGKDHPLLTVRIEATLSSDGQGCRIVVVDITKRKQTEEALKESEERYRTLSYNIPGMIYRAGTDWSTQVITNLEEVCGYSIDEWDHQKMSWLDLIHPDDKQGVIEGGSKLAIKPISIIQEYRIISKDGKIRWVSDHKTSFVKDDGSFNGVYGIVFDITERKQAEETLKESEEKYRTLIQATSEGFWLLDSDQKTIDVNQSLYDMLGYSKSEMIGKTPFDFVNDENHKIFKEQTSQITNTLHRTYEIILKKKNGIHFPAIFNATSLIDKKGEPAGSFAFVTDITERKLAEAKLQKSKQLYRLVADNSNDWIYLMNLDQKLLYVSPSSQRITGYLPTEFINNQELFFNIIHPDDREQTKSHLEDLIEYSQIHSNEFRIITKEGKIRWIGHSCLPAYTEDGKFSGRTGTNRDITDRKKTEQQIKERIKELEILYGLGEIAEKEGLTLDKLYQELTDILPQGCQCPEVACARIVIGDSEFRTNNFAESAWLQSAPVKVSGTVVGKIEVGYLEEMPEEGEGPFLKEEKQLIDSIAERLGQITRRRQAEGALKQTLKSLRKAVGTTIEVIVSTLEARDPYTAGHQVRVADLAHAIATEMKFSKDRIEGVFMAASIHDIGKLSIPAEILSKPGKLTEIEFSMIKEHPRKGCEILKNVESSWPLAEIVYQHHERMDGSGYPRNLKGDEILMEARIMAVADVVEAMASHRPYRAALGIDAVLKEIEDNRGVLYDADVVDVCLRLFREKGYQLKGN